MEQIVLKIAWALTIHKSQGLTLTRSTIDISNNEHQELTFVVMPHTAALEGIQITSTFSSKHYAKMKETSSV